MLGTAKPHLALLTILGLLGACDSVIFAPQVAVTRDEGSRLEILIFACRAEEPLNVRLSIDPDDLSDTGDETVLWDIRGRADEQGLMRIPLGRVPSGFRESVPYKDHLQPKTEYAVDLFSQGMTFTPSEIGIGQISREGKKVTESQFVRDAQEICENQTSR